MALNSDQKLGHAYLDALSLLPNRGFGGIGVADSGVAASDDSGFFVKGPLATGALEALQWFNKSIASNDPQICSFLFLVGAPGNGKSYIASEVQRDLIEIGNRTLQKHHRKHEFKHENGCKVAIVNDATIPAIDIHGVTQQRSLISDIEGALDNREFLLANVNRGILFEELQASPEESVSRSIVDWLSGSDHPALGSGWEQKAQESKDERSDDAIGSIVFVNSELDLEVHVLAVRVDSYSMLETAPQVSNIGNGLASFPFMETAYRMKRFNQRTSEYCESTAAGLLLNQFFSPSHFNEPDVHLESLVDPFAANLENFRGSGFRQGFQNILRAAELVASHKLTYRELWGAISVAMIGTHAKPVEWLYENQPVSESGRQRLNDLMKLASCRTHQSIFGAAQVEIGVNYTSVKTPTTVLTANVDPAIDAIPGELRHGSNGWAGFVLEAFQAQAEGESILSALEELLEERGDSAHSSITTFDRILDKEITEALNGQSQWLADHEKQFLVAWYGEYLLRFYALSHGVPAFSVEVQKLTDAWVDARREGSLEMDTERSIRTLLLPYYSQDSDTKPVFLPIFNSRTEPIVNLTETPRLVLRTRDQLNLKVDTYGDSIFIELQSAQEVVGKMSLDFALLREALTCEDNQSGQTELAESLTPRIERFRSSMLHNKASNGYYMVYGRKNSRITRD
jgi:hypothetical protein